MCERTDQFERSGESGEIDKDRERMVERKTDTQRGEKRNVNIS